MRIHHEGGTQVGFQAGFRALTYTFLHLLCTACYIVLLNYIRTNKIESERAALAMMIFVDLLIAGLAFDVILGHINMLFFTERLFRKNVEISQASRAVSRLPVLGNQNALEGFLETLEEAINYGSSVYLSGFEAVRILRKLKLSFWRMRVIHGRVVVIRTWEPLFVAAVMLSTQLISSLSIKWTIISFADALQYIEIVTITALLTVNIAPLFMDIGSASQIVSYKISSDKINAMFSALGAISRKGILKYENDHSANYLTSDLDGVSPFVKVHYLRVPDGWLPPQQTSPH